MNLYVLTSRTDAPTSNYAVFVFVAGFVVAAEDEPDARSRAAEFPGDEGTHVWVNPALSECHLIGHALPGTVPGILMRDFHSG
jgi:hypothetical protein